MTNPINPLDEFSEQQLPSSLANSPEMETLRRSVARPPAVSSSSVFGPQATAPVNSPSLPTKASPVSTDYVNSGLITIDQVINGDASKYIHLDEEITRIVAEVQEELVNTGREIDKARYDNDLKSIVISDIDRLVTAKLLASGRNAPADKPIIVASVINEIVGLGPIEPIWQDSSITEVIVNGPNAIYIERGGKLIRAKGIRFRDQDHLLAICTRIVGPIGRKIDIANPLVDARLPDGSRVNAVHYEIAPRGPLLTIRRFPEVNRSLVDLVTLGSMTKEMACTLAWLVSNRASTLVVGGTGTGKLVPLSTKIPTPNGWTTMGELNIGDEIFGRDGKICRVKFISDIEKTPDLYRILFSDNQEVIADADHQWLISDFNDRRRPRRDGKRESSLKRYQDRLNLIAGMQEVVKDIEVELMNTKEIWALIQHLDIPWKNSNSLWHALEDSNCPSIIKRDITIVTRREHTIPQKVKYFNTHNVCDAMVEHLYLRSKTKGNSPLVNSRINSLTSLKDTTSQDDYMPLQSILSALNKTDSETNRISDAFIYSVIRKNKVAYSLATEIKNRKTNLNTIQETSNSFYEPKVAIEFLSKRLMSIYDGEPSLKPDYQVLTTKMMIEKGLSLVQGHSRFAVPISQSINLPNRDLAVDPYTLGAWLGDGGTGSGSISGLDLEIFYNIEKAGYQVTHSKSVKKNHYVKGLTTGLREIGCFFDKRIPLEYMRSSNEQRLALLQGLMDTDGSIDKNGACEISLNKADLAEDVLSLIRSLGIKASVTKGPSTYLATDKITGLKYRKVTGVRNRIKFTTTIPVFKLSRKLSRLPLELRQTSNWNYITKIEPIETEPGRCIQVDSSDSTYLIKDFIPTHNTTLLNALSAAIPRDERVITIEDSLELRLHPTSHVAAMEARPSDAKHQNAIAIKDLVKNALRMRPDRIIVGEVRGAEALNMLEACNTGHEGSMSTIHANGSNEALARLAVMIAQGGEMPSDKVDWLVGSALDLMIQIKRDKDGMRRITGIYEVPDIYTLPPGQPMRTIPLWEWHRTGEDANGKFIGEYKKVNEISEILKEKLGLEFDPIFEWDRVVEICRY